MDIADLRRRLAEFPRAPLAALPTPLHPLPRLTEHLGGPELWIKRDDLTGLAGGGNKTRRLEFLVADAMLAKADTVVTVGALQSNHTRQTAAAAARAGLGCVLLHNAWTAEPGPQYRTAGNILLSELLGAELIYDETPRPIGDEGVLAALVDKLAASGRRPYLIPGGGSDHPLGGLGYAAAAAELLEQAGAGFDAIVHCTGSSGTQAGLLAGLAALESDTAVIGISDDDATEDKAPRVLRLANATLEALGAPAHLGPQDVEIVVADPSPYGSADSATIDAIRLLARTEGLIADPVYEGKAVRGLMRLIDHGRLRRGQRVLLLHMGGTPAVHAYADQLRQGPSALTASSIALSREIGPSMRSSLPPRSTSSV